MYGHDGMKSGYEFLNYTISCHTSTAHVRIIIEYNILPRSNPFVLIRRRPNGMPEKPVQVSKNSYAVTHFFLNTNLRTFIINT